MDAASVAGRLFPLVFALSPKNALSKGKVDADERGQAETLVLEFIIAGHLGLAIIVDENDALVMHQVSSFSRH